MKALNLVTALAVLVSGCDDGLTMVDGAVKPGDGGASDLGVAPDGGGPLGAAFTMLGCASLEQSSPSPVCTGPAPLELTFVPLAAGVDTFLWTFTGGTPPTSKLLTPTAMFAKPGTYMVSVAAGGTAGTTSATGTVIVTAGGIGAPCSDPSDCDVGVGLTCVCGGGECPGGLNVGLCTRSCATQPCAPGEVCADLTRGAPLAPPDDGGTSLGDGGTSAGEWRRALCVKPCMVSTQCRPGLLCRELPSPAAGMPPGGTFTWQRGCFADLLGDVGDGCAAATGAPANDRCTSGRCDPYGARGLCTAACGLTQACPLTSACATFNGQPGSPACLRRCDPAHPCTDPLLACETAGKAGALGFTVPAGEPASSTFCAPKKCTLPADCAPAGVCTPMGAGSFCTKI